MAGLHWSRLGNGLHSSLRDVKSWVSNVLCCTECSGEPGWVNSTMGISDEKADLQIEAHLFGVPIPQAQKSIHGTAVWG